MNNDRAVYESLLRLSERVENPTIHRLPTICKWVEQDLGLSVEANQAALLPLFVTWEKFSGDLGFPVTGGQKISPVSLYYKARNDPDGYWDRRTEYGANRRELLTHLIHHLLIKTHADMEPRAELRVPL